MDSSDLEAEIQKRQKLGSCEVCNKNQAKYTCPKCEIHTCSLICSKIHKKEVECDGIRDKTKYIPLKKMTSMDFMNDYYFLEEATRFTKEIKGNWKVKFSKKISPALIKLRQAAQQRNTKLFFLASSLKKRKKNFSSYDHKTDTITWYTEINFPNADFKKYEKINENIKLVDTIQTIIDDSENKELEFYKGNGLSKLKVMLKAEGLKRSANRYYELNFKKSLRSNLNGKVLIEFPSISVVMDHCADQYEMILSDDESIQEEQKEFAKTLQEEIFARKIGENPMFILKPCEVPIIADVLNEDNQKTDTIPKTSNEDQQQCDTYESVSDDNDEIKPENYFF